jgi:hypothetical protein
LQKMSISFDPSWQPPQGLGARTPIKGLFTQSDRWTGCRMIGSIHFLSCRATWNSLHICRTVYVNTPWRSRSDHQYLTTATGTYLLRQVPRSSHERDESRKAQRQGWNHAICKVRQTYFLGTRKMAHCCTMSTRKWKALSAYLFDWQTEEKITKWKHCSSYENPNM